MDTLTITLIQSHLQDNQIMLDLMNDDFFCVNCTLHTLSFGASWPTSRATASFEGVGLQGQCKLPNVLPARNGSGKCASGFGKGELSRAHNLFASTKHKRGLWAHRHKMQIYDRQTVGSHRADTNRWKRSR